MEPRVATTMGTGSWYRAKLDTVSRVRSCKVVQALHRQHDALKAAGDRFDDFAPKTFAMEQLGDIGHRYGHDRIGHRTSTDYRKGARR